MDTNDTDLVEENQPAEPSETPRRLPNQGADVPSLRGAAKAGRVLRIVRLLLPVERRHAFALQEQDDSGQWQMLTFKVGFGKKRQSKIEQIGLEADILEFLKRERIEDVAFTNASAWSVFLEVFPPLGSESRYEVLR